MTVPRDYPPRGPLGATDPTRWRLHSSDHGRHVWQYDKAESSCPAWGTRLDHGDTADQTDETKYWLGLDADAPNLKDPAGNPFESAKNGQSLSLQAIGQAI